MIAIFLLFACDQDFNIGTVDSQLVASPPLADAGDLNVGETVEVTLRLDHVAGGAVEVRAVDVFDVEGEYFTLLTAEMPLIGAGESADLVFEYAPMADGWHRAVVTVTSNAAATPQIEATLRGHAAPLDLAVWPGLLDFGPVVPPATSIGVLTVANLGDADAVLTSFTAQPVTFSLVASLPVTLGAHTETDLTVLFDPSDAAAVTGQVTLGFGSISLDPVVVRANACTAGDPSLYDVDGDGWTMCAGDCDDVRADVHPGAREVADGADQDCDQTVDEQTSVFDDDGDCRCEGTSCADSASVACVFLQTGDCNDGDPDVFSGAIEDYDNGVDDDCDGTVDYGSIDADADGYGPGGGDCNDNAANVYPGAVEAPDGIDNDCDVDVDEGTIRADDDGDGYCEFTACSDGADPGDCDDSPNADVTHPGAGELADGVDNDCDGDVDEGTAYADDDHDGYSEQGGDCDDANPGRSPGIREVTGNGVDEDCNASTGP